MLKWKGNNIMNGKWIYLGILNQHNEISILSGGSIIDKLLKESS